MSVWSDPHYRSEPLVVATEYLEPGYKDHPNVLALCDFTVGDYGHFECSVPIGHFKTNIQLGKAPITSIAYRYGRLRDSMFTRRFSMLYPPKAGIEAVYELYSDIYQKKLQLAQEFDTIECQSFCSDLLRAFGPANYASPRTWADLANSHFKTWDPGEITSPLFWAQQAEAFRHLLVAQGLKSHRRMCHKFKLERKPLPSIDRKTIFGNPKATWDCYRFRNLTILEDHRRKRSYLLLNKDINRLSQMLESTSKILHYFTLYADTPGALSHKLLMAANEILDILVMAFRTTTPDQKNSICRSFDICQYIYLADAAGSLASRSATEQRAKLNDGHYNKVLNTNLLLQTLSRFQLREAMELCSIRKMLPVPDFCIYSAMNNCYLMHMSPFKQVPHNDPNINLDDFSTYWSYSMIRNYYDRHKRCPGKIKPNIEEKPWHRYYPEIEPIKIPYREVVDINYEGTFIYTDYQHSEHTLRNDKTMAPARLPNYITSDELRELPITDKNQVASLFLNPNLPRLAEYRKMVTEGSESFDYVHLTALKPEAKKEGGRMFYMANDAQRVMMSEKEANIADYLVHKAGNCSGISDIELDKRMQSIAKRVTDPIRKVHVSFDLEKFSPRQSPWIKREAYRQWSYAFGLTHISKLLKVHTESRLAFVKHNVHHEYINPGQDMEGYDAKTNTAMHIEVMSYAINVCRRKKLLTKSAELLAFVDDGGMSLEFPLTATDDEIWECIRMIESVYQMVGLRISWDKTFVSTKLFMFLNEIFYHGFKVTPGLKAFLRVGKLDDSPAKTICDDLDTIAAEIQGAVKAGTGYYQAYCAYIFEVYRVIKRWSRYKNQLTTSHVLMCLLPVAYGGIGIRSLLQLVTNEAFNPVVAGLGNVKAFVTAYPNNAHHINSLLNAKMREMSSEGFLRSPSSIRSEGLTINVQRFHRVMQDWILNNAKNPFVLEVLASVKTQSSEQLALRVSLMPEVSAVGLKTIGEMRPELAVDVLIRKLQRSSTAAELLGFKEVLRIAIANRYQAAKLIGQFDSAEKRISLRK